MADLNKMMQMDPRYQSAANYFPPLTPEEQAALQRQAVTTEMPLPIELLLAGGGMGALGRAAGRGIGNTASYLMRIDAPDVVNNLGRVFGAAGVLSGLGGSYDAANQRRTQNTIRDAEGQPGGFYGDPRRR